MKTKYLTELCHFESCPILKVSVLVSHICECVVTDSVGSPVYDIDEVSGQLYHNGLAIYSIAMYAVTLPQCLCMGGYLLVYIHKYAFVIFYGVRTVEYRYSFPCDACGRSLCVALYCQ